MEDILNESMKKGNVGPKEKVLRGKNRTGWVRDEVKTHAGGQTDGPRGLRARCHSV